MERQIGEVFPYKGKKYQVVLSSGICKDCAFNDGTTCLDESLKSKRGKCYRRKDQQYVIFKLYNMNIKNNQLNIEIPEGMEIDIVNTDLTEDIIKFKIKNLTYDEVDSTIHDKYGITHELTGMSSHNIAKLSNLDKLLDIAKYYNKDWEPDWNDIDGCKYYILKHNDKYFVTSTVINNYGIAYFKNKEDAQAVIGNPNFKDILDSIYK